MLAALAALAAGSPATAAPAPGATFNLLSFGGKGAGATDNTAAFAAAAAAVAAAGGGTLFVPGAGVYKTRSFNLTSNMTLFIEGGATIQSSLDFLAWPLVAPLDAYPADGPRYAPLINGYRVRDVLITGNTSSAGEPPEIDGLGLVWDVAYFAKLLKGQRPHAIEFVGSVGIEIGAVAVKEAAYWSVHFSECGDVHMHDTTVISTTENGDGVDIGARNVLLERVYIATADDAIAVKSGDAPPGSGLPSARNIIIRDSTLSSGEACVAIGSEMTAGVEDVLVRNVTCGAAGHALLYIKERQDGGGFVQNVVVADSFVSGPLERFLWISQHFGEHGENAEQGASASLPVLSNITMRNIVVVAGGGVIEPLLLNGARAPPGVAGSGAILGVSLEDSVLGAALQQSSCANASGTWRNVTPAPCSALTPVAL